MGFKESLKVGFRKAFVFDGRASLREFWWFFLWIYILQSAATVVLLLVMTVVGFGAVGASVADESPVGIAAGFGFFWLILTVFSLMIVALGLPIYAATARRLHDTGQTGWLVLLNLAGLGIVPTIMCLFDGQPFENRWGPVPEK